MDGLQPGSRYAFSYELKTPEGEILETRTGCTFRTFENDPERFSFTATSGARPFSESEAFLSLTAAGPDLVIQLGDMHSSGDEYYPRGAFQQAYGEVFKSMS